jgi:L-threonate 2-dehydrogenase
VPPRVGIAGLGIMGSAYARHLVDAGFATAGYDVEPAAIERFRALGGTVVESPRALAASSDIVITALPSVAALNAVCIGSDGIAVGAKPGLVVLEHGTFSLDDKERVRAGLAAHGVGLLDAPVSGTGSQAQEKDLVIFISGDHGAYETANGVASAYARDVRFVGPFGNGSKLKYIANLLVTIHNLSTAEAVVLAEKAGIDPMVMLDALHDSAATSRMFQVRGPMMAKRTYTPPAMKMDVYAKDIAVIGEFARDVGAPTPLFSQSTLFYTAALENGHAKDDTAAIVTVLRTMAGLEP